MYSLSTLRDLNAEEVKRHYSGRPLHLIRCPEDLRHSPDYSGGDMNEAAKHFRVKKHEEYFVDSSGFGSSGEPALTYQSFSGKVSDLLAQYPGRKWYAALSGVGQFQVYVTLFYKEVQQRKAA